MRRRDAARVGLALLSAAAAGCGGDPRFKPVFQTRGQVFYEGKPAPGASVTFHPLDVEDHPWTKPSAEVGDDGGFVVQTYRTGDGIPAGKYRVTLMWLPPNFAGPDIQKANKLPARYANEATSGLIVEIPKGENVLPAFQLTK